jgi:transposase
MEACGSAHDWTRRFQAHGHRVGIAMARFVAPYRKSSKSDGNDAEAICEAVARPNMRFVPVKSAEQQAILALHRVRQGFLEQRTATINRIRGLLAGFGVVLPQRAEQVRRAAAVRIQRRPGVGPLTASAITASISDGHEFANGRQFAAWLGLVPRQYSTGGKPRLGRITKRGDAYLRTLPMLGARAVLQSAGCKTDHLSRRAIALRAGRGHHRAIIAVAAESARIIWALLANNREFAPTA